MCPTSYRSLSKYTALKATARRESRRRRNAKRAACAIGLAAAAVPLGDKTQQARADISGFGEGTTATNWQLNGNTVFVSSSDLQMTDAVNRWTV